jgi:hypothetical protein
MFRVLEYLIESSNCVSVCRRNEKYSDIVAEPLLIKAAVCKIAKDNMQVILAIYQQRAHCQAGL